jgi:hypothetical protein
MADWIAAPQATASSGLSEAFGLSPKTSSTSSRTAGMRVEPPTSNTSESSSGAMPASFMAVRQGGRSAFRIGAMS